MNPNSLNRRQLLKGVVQGGLALPLSGLLGNAARAAEAPPKRALFVYIPDGCSQAHWQPTGSQGNFSLPQMTAPLNPVKSDLVMLQGLNMYSGGSTHEGGIAKMLTATGDVSMDVLVGQYYRDQVAHSSVHLGIAANHQNGGNFMSFQGKEQPITPEDNPLRAFERLFGVGDGISDIQQRRRLSVLDTVLDDLTRLRGELGQTERLKLELHENALREVEQRIRNSAEAPGGTCGNPDWNSQGWAVPEDYCCYPLYWNLDDQFATVGRLQMDLAVLALQCDLTRSVAIQWSHAVSPTNLSGEGIGVSQGHHDSSHFDENNQASISNFINYKRWYTEQFAYLINQLRAVPTGDGSSLLDHTLVFLCSELGHSARHNHKDMPFVVAGGSALGLQTGRYLDYRSANGGDGDSHAKLLVSIANYLGINIDSFGYTGHGSGPLSGF